MTFRIALFLSFLSIVTAHPIIVLLTHPRSLSTAFERIMRERGDMDVLHEPFTYLYYLEHFPDAPETLEFGKRQLPTTLSELCLYLTEASKQQPIFIKDMAFGALEYLQKDPQLFEENEVHIVLLKRDPIKSLTSLYSLEPTADFEFIGYEAAPKNLYKSTYCIETLAKQCC